MDELKIRLYPDGKPDSVAAWNWELLLNGKKIAGGKSPGTALVKERERRAKKN
jgi:hypothetical protein